MSTQHDPQPPYNPYLARGPVEDNAPLPQMPPPRHRSRSRSRGMQEDPTLPVPAQSRHGRSRSQSRNVLDDPLSQLQSSRPRHSRSHSRNVQGVPTPSLQPEPSRHTRSHSGHGNLDPTGLPTRSDRPPSSLLRTTDAPISRGPVGSPGRGRLLTPPGQQQQPLDSERRQQGRTPLPHRNYRQQSPEQVTCATVQQTPPTLPMYTVREAYAPTPPPSYREASQTNPRPYPPQSSRPHRSQQTRAQSDTSSIASISTSVAFPEPSHSLKVLSVTTLIFGLLLAAILATCVSAGKRIGTRDPTDSADRSGGAFEGTIWSVVLFEVFGLSVIALPFVLRSCDVFDKPLLAWIMCQPPHKAKDQRDRIGGCCCGPASMTASDGDSICCGCCAYGLFVVFLAFIIVVFGGICGYFVMWRLCWLGTSHMYDRHLNKESSSSSDAADIAV
ncbi:hypothetical protein DFJ77DRAFT_165493 [Powellomyces hirtus]|nr:hypothetical protein DFJ77DRAFT_165493 [Powellomyces hirtus]